MKRWIWAALLVATMVGAGFAAAPTQAAPSATPVREFSVDDGHFIGLSPDGAMYAVAIPGTALCVYDTETTEQISCGSLEAAQSGVRFEDVVWSPDSTRLVFAENAFVTARDGDLWVMEAATGTLTDVTDDGYDGSILGIDDESKQASYFVDVDPAWTPDSQFITFSRSGWQGGQRTGNQIAQVSATGGEVQTLASVSNDEPGVVSYGSGWSPDGATFYYALTHSDFDNPENGIWTYDAATGETALLARGDDPKLGPLTLLQVSPAGDQLLGWYPAAFGEFQADSDLLRLIDTASGAMSEPPAPETATERILGTTLATFSPDGTALLQFVRVRDGKPQLWVTDLASGASTVLIDALPDAAMDLGLMPSWAANGAAAIGKGIGGGYLTTISGIGIAQTAATSPEGATPVETAVASPQAAGVPVGGEVQSFDLESGRAASMSPDGRYIVVVEPPDTSLCIYAAETMAQVSCADPSVLNAGIRVADLVWSPDSTRIAFSENVFTYFKDGDLWVMDAASGQLTDLTDDGFDGSIMFGGEQPTTSYYADVSPAWTPDGQFITFSRTTYQQGDSTGNIVAQVPANGGDVQTLTTVSPTEQGVFYYRGGWSPDGSRFFYSVLHPDPDEAGSGIWVYDTATGAVQLLASADADGLGPLSFLEISSTGDRILAWYPQATGQFGRGTESFLRFVDPVSGAVSPVPDPTPDSNPADYDGTWIATFSPDGRWFLQVAGIDFGAMDVWVTDLQTGASTKVAGGLDHPAPIEYQLGPVWGSNGVVFVSHSLEGVYLIPIAGVGLLDAGSDAAAQTSPVASPVAADGFIDEGTDARTTGIAPIYAGPDTQSPLVHFLPPNQVVRVLGDPVHNAEGSWYPVFDPHTQIIGYVQADRLEQIA